MRDQVIAMTVRSYVCLGHSDRSASSVSLCFTKQHRPDQPQHHSDGADGNSGYIHHKPN